MNAPQRSFCTSISVWLAALASVCIATNSMATPGDLDSTFDTDGIAVLTPPWAQQSTTGRTVLTLDQKIVIAGVCTNASVQTFCLIRLNANGSLDSTFGTSGVAFGLTVVDKNIRSVTGLDIDPNTQALVVAGTCRPPQTGSSESFCLTRFSAAGVHESSFGVYAPLVVSTANITVGRLRVGADSKIKLALGLPRTTVVGESDMAILALNADGSPDTAFVNSSTAAGLVGIKLLAAPVTPTGKQYLSDLSIRPDGSTVYVGACQRNTNGNFFYWICIGAVSPTGVTLQSSWTYISDFDDDATQLMPLPDGSFVVAGTSDRVPPEYGTAMISARVTLSGGTLSRVTSWGTNGNYVGPYYYSYPVAPTLYGYQGSPNYAVDNDGKLYFQYCYGGDGSSCSQERVARFTAFGVPDTSWGTNGVFQIPSNPVSTATMGNLLVQADGKLVAAGGSALSSNFVTAVRMTNDSMPGFACSMDIDGDGKVLPTTDGLLLSRALMGMTGNSVIQSATGVGATRATWAAIRDYLVLRCGLKLKP